MKLIGIMAATQSGVIGSNGMIPWSYPDETSFFRSVTRNNVIVMGRKTYDNLPAELLKDRCAIVISRNLSLSCDNALVVHSIDECHDAINAMHCRKAFMIGGGELLNSFMRSNCIFRFLLTEIRHDFHGDACIDMTAFSSWKRRMLFTCDDYDIFYCIKGVE